MNKQNTDIIRLRPEHLDELRASIDWQALFTGLGFRKADAKSKPNDWWAYSPFHDEKTPSFHMGPGGLWFDFSIGEGGGAIELVQKLQSNNCFEAGRFILGRRPINQFMIQIMKRRMFHVSKFLANTRTVQ